MSDFPLSRLIGHPTGQAAALHMPSSGYRLSIKWQCPSVTGAAGRKTLRNKQGA